MAQKILIKTDKNGTKYYHNVDRCPRCGGTGIVEIYRPVNGGDCFQCWGSGIIEYDTKEYTPEYETKLEVQRQKREAKRIVKLEAELPAKQAEWLKHNGIDQNGHTYIFLGNTYEIKEELKALGAKVAKALINELPSVTPQPKHGIWQQINKNEVNVIPEYRCSNCSAEFKGFGFDFDYCPRCGCAMEEEE